MKKLREEHLICNSCGRTLRQENGICREDFVRIVKKWGYFSDKDMQKHTVVLCEDCYDRWTRHLMVPPTVEEDTEPLIAENA